MLGLVFLAALFLPPFTHTEVFFLFFFMAEGCKQRATLHFPRDCLCVKVLLLKTKFRHCAWLVWVSSGFWRKFKFESVRSLVALTAHLWPRSPGPSLCCSGPAALGCGHSGRPRPSPHPPSSPRSGRRQPTWTLPPLAPVGGEAKGSGGWQNQGLLFPAEK